MVALLLLTGCGEGIWNNPYPASEDEQNILYSSFQERPKHLDPARSYSASEYAFIGQVYEPPLQYHYLKRPYQLIPLTAESVPEPVYLDIYGRQITDAHNDDNSAVAFSVYDIKIKPGVQYQPHPAFARDQQGDFIYHQLQESDLDAVYVLSDFKHTGSRELTAADYVYQIKRLAHPQLHSPILGIMSDYIVGLKDYQQTLQAAYQAQLDAGDDRYLDLRAYDLPGVELIDRYTYRITVKGKYPQLIYWLAMPFFAPMAQEVDYFYSQPGMAEKNMTLDWYPVGTGAYMLSVNNPNRKMVLVRNPNFHGEQYPVSGEASDQAAGLLDDAGKELPFIDKMVFSLEKENIPYWNKFLQGFYDTSGISSDSFDQAVSVGGGGDVRLTDDMVDKGIRLQTAVNASTFYIGFNMQDPVLGGYSERQRKLRQAISIAMDYEEYISIFMNGRGIPAQGAIPPGIFGFRDNQQGMNPYVYEWKQGQARRKPLVQARQLLADAGYPDGVDVNTGKPLVLYLDITASGPDDKARLEWYRKQFRKLSVQLVVRNTDYNRFREKMQKGNAQIFIWGWNADYPDPENFLFLLYGPNGKVDYYGENAANYANPEFDALFDKMKNMPSNQQRQQIIDQMMRIAQRDAPWIWGLHPKSFSLYHGWVKNNKLNLMANNTMKYRRIDAVQRQALRAQWNPPIVWPLSLLVLLFIALVVPAYIMYRRRERHVPVVSAVIDKGDDHA